MYNKRINNIIIIEFLLQIYLLRLLYRYLPILNLSVYRKILKDHNIFFPKLNYNVIIL